MRREPRLHHGPARTDGDPASAAFFPWVILGIRSDLGKADRGVQGESRTCNRDSPGAEAASRPST
jgi:hypothetical protein